MNDQVKAKMDGIEEAILNLEDGQVPDGTNKIGLELTGEGGGTFLLDLKGDHRGIREVGDTKAADATVVMRVGDFLEPDPKKSPQAAFADGTIRIKGDPRHIIALGQVLPKATLAPAS